jgi:hypothetical protein
MIYHEFTNDSLIMMHHGARGALAVDDELNRLGQGSRFKARETPGWRKHADDLETEMIRRGMVFERIDWRERHETWCLSGTNRAPALLEPEPCSPPTDPAALLRKRIAAIIKK